MNIFNRREVFMSTSFEKASQMRAKIQAGSVECVMSSRSLTRSGRGAYSGRAGMLLMEYRLYVHKNDVEIAVSLMNRPGF